MERVFNNFSENFTKPVCDAWRRINGSARRVALVGLVATSTRAGIVHAAEPEVVADGRDDWTLLYRHPVNHQLFEQLSASGNSYRLGPRRGVITALSDVSVGTQQVLDASSEQSRYHGWFLANTFLGVRPLAGLDVNLNLLMLNPSASDGYRASGFVHPGLNLHLYRDLFNLDRHPVRLDIMGSDLGWVTAGNGLLLESAPLEGVRGIARWKDWELDYLFAGRGYWSDDDYEALSLSALKRKVQLGLVNWQKYDPPAGAPPVPGATQQHAYYATLGTRWPIVPWLRLATEFGYRVDKQPRVGVLGRVDVLLRDRADYAIHLGYQFRFYQAGFGPRDRMLTPTWAFNSPMQQDAYVTNPFEYFGLSPAYDQWSHTVMAEGRGRVGFGVEVFANTELWVRFARSSTVPKFAVYTSEGFRAPGQATNVYYQAGLRYYPWSLLPHRLSVSLTNKQVQAAERPTDPVQRRFAPGNFYLLALEAYL